LSERSDAVVIVVSEERGEVTVALAGTMEKIDTPEHLSEKLHALLIRTDQEIVRISILKRIFSDLRPKIVTVFLVLICWLIITAKQGGIITVSTPIKFHNLPDDLIFIKSSPEEVEVQAKIFSKLIPSPKQLDIEADVDLANIREGTTSLTVKNDDLQLPLGVMVSGINPTVVKVTAERKMRKTLRVKVKTKGSLPGGGVLRKIKVNPATVTAEGPEHALSQLESVATEEIDLSAVLQSVLLEKGLHQPVPLVKIVPDEPVKVQLVISRR
jgi:hypothetical protein